MKIAIITYYNFNTEHSGAVNRVLGLARALSNNAKVTIIHRGSNCIIDKIVFIGYSSILSNFPTIESSLSAYICYLNIDLYRVLKKVIAEVDVLQIEQPYLLIISMFVCRLLNINIPIVLDAHNVDFMTAKSKIKGISVNTLFSVITLPYIFFNEYISVKLAKSVLCVSKSDWQLFLSLYRLQENKLLLIPNGVDVFKFKKISKLAIGKIPKYPFAFFHGTLSWSPNLEAANFIVDYIAPRLPEVFFVIAGKSPPRFFLKKILKLKNAIYIGFLTNLEAYIKSAEICIAPILSGGGTKLKLLEYMAAEKPIVATFEAVKGLDVKNGVHGLFYHHVDDDFVNGIKILIKNTDLPKIFARNEKHMIKSYDWAIIGKDLYNFYLYCFFKK